MKNPVVDKLFDIVRTSSEEEVRKYIFEHWIDFPIDVQDALASALIADSVRDQLATV